MTATATADPPPYEVTPSDLRIARVLARRFATRSKTWHLIDEWESAAMLGLARAVSLFDPGRHLKFWTFAHRKVVGAILDAARLEYPAGYRRGRENGRPAILTLSAVVAYDHDEDKPLRVADLLASDDDPVGWAAEWHDEIAGLSRKLPPPVGRVFKIYHGSAPSGAATARALGISESRVRQCVTAAHELLRRRACPPFP